MTPAAANERKPRAKTPARRQPGKPKALSIPQAKRAKYLELVATGTPLDEAARAIGATGRLMRSLAHNDPEFAEARQAAIAEARAQDLEEYVPKLRAARRKLAVDELDGRMLHYESIAHDPEYRAAHQKTTVEMTATHTSQVEVTIEHTAQDVAWLLNELHAIGLIQPGPALPAHTAGLAVLETPSD